MLGLTFYVVPSAAMNLFQSLLVLLLILVEAAPPTATSVPTLGNMKYFCIHHGDHVFLFEITKNALVSSSRLIRIHIHACYGSIAIINVNIIIHSGAEVYFRRQNLTSPRWKG